MGVEKCSHKNQNFCSIPFGLNCLYQLILYRIVVLEVKNTCFQVLHCLLLSSDS